jgi:NAD(P)-dependent dehydrogenase (short-subunit alcohol dehydrogenase family)
MAKKTLLVLGAGSNVGVGLAKKFAGNGFQIAIASRTINPELAKIVDASKRVKFSVSTSVKDVFAWVKAEVGVPSVVVYNGKGILKPEGSKSSSY